MAEPERAVDLRTVANALPAKRRDLRQLIRDALALHSAQSDLKITTDFCGHLVALQQSTGHGLPQQFVEDCCLSLLCSAIVFYSRAMKSGSRHRKVFDLRSLMDSNEREAHELLCRLRDDAVAHYGPGPLSHTISLRDDGMFLPADSQQLVFTTRSLSGSLSFSHLMRRQAQRALLLMQRKFEAKQTELVDALNAAADDPVVKSAFADAEVDFAQAIGDPNMAKSILGGARVGSRRVSGSIG